jgi:predicted nucleic acid-binding protein
VAIVFLVDTNLFLEILLSQDKKEKCRKFLNGNIGNLNITDFSLHSIGVILFRYNKNDVFQKFIDDILPKVKLISLPIKLYGEVVKANKNLNLDFDDAYQYTTAKHYGLKLATMDSNFEKIKDPEILFL